MIAAHTTWKRKYGDGNIIAYGARHGNFGTFRNGKSRHESTTTHRQCASYEETVRRGHFNEYAV
jgi:hypothetical protein